MPQIHGMLLHGQTEHNFVTERKHKRKLKQIQSQGYTSDNQIQDETIYRKGSLPQKIKEKFK